MVWLKFRVCIGSDFFSYSLNWFLHPFCREIAKNAMLRWGPFLYWTILGIFQGLLFFFGVKYLYTNPALQDNGQVSVISGHSLTGQAVYSNAMTILSSLFCAFLPGVWKLVLWNNSFYSPRFYCHTKGWHRKQANICCILYIIFRYSI